MISPHPTSFDLVCFFLKFFECTIFRGWCKIIVWKSRVCQNWGFQKMGGRHLFRVWWWWWLLLHDVTRWFRGVFKKPYKNSFPLVARCKKQTNIPKKQKGNFLTPLFFGGGGIKSVQEVLPLFCPPPKKRILKILQNPYFYSVSSKNVGGRHFFIKAYVKRRRLLEGQNKW